MDAHHETKEDRIRRRAYHLWLDGGQPQGRDEDHWHAAALAIEAEDHAAAAPHAPAAAPGDPAGPAREATVAAAPERAPR